MQNIPVAAQGFSRYTSRAMTTTHTLPLQIAKAAADFKAEEIRILDLRGLTSFTEYYVICSGQSDRQVQAIADHIAHQLKAAGLLPVGIEGYEAGQWVLLDYNDVVVHVFHPLAREFYQIEKIWGDAPQIPLAQAS